MRLTRRSKKKGEQDLKALIEAFMPFYLGHFRRARACEQQYRATNDPSILQEALACWHRIMDHPTFPKTPPDFQLVIQGALGGTHLRCYQASRDSTHLNTALSLWRGALIRPELDPASRPMLLVNLGTGLVAKFGDCGDAALLDEAVTLLEEACDLMPEDDLDYPAALNSLGAAMSTRYDLRGDQADLESSISTQERALERVPADSAEYPRHLSSLAGGLGRLYDRSGDLTKLDQSIRLFRQALDHSALHESDRSTLVGNLSAALLRRYGRSSDMADLDQVIDLLQPPRKFARRSRRAGTADGPLGLTTLGSALVSRFERSKDPADLHQGVKALQKAGELMPSGSPAWSPCLSNLGAALVTQSRLLGDLSRHPHAIEAFRRAIKWTPHGSPLLYGYLNNLAAACQELHDAADDPALLDEGIGAYHYVCKNSPAPQEVLQSGQFWGDWAVDRKSWDEAVEAYNYAFQASTKLFQEGGARQDKESWLAAARNLPARFAYALARTGNYAEALLALENGSARLLSDALALEAGLPGDPLTLADLQKAAVAAPLVYLPVAPAGAMALICPADGQIQAIWLDDLDDESLYQKITGYSQDQVRKLFALEDGIPSRHMKGYFGAYIRWLNDAQQGAQVRDAWWTGVDEITSWLWSVLMGPLTEHLVGTGQEQAVLIPQGMLCQLPLHAAWREDQTTPTGRRHALDLVQLTYAPNGRGLLASQGIADRVRPESIFAVDNPDGSLRFADLEISAALAHFPSGRKKLLGGDAAERAAVLRHMPGADVLHFSTHGLADFSEPLNSELRLAAGERLTLRDLLDLKLDRLRLAVLSACESGATGTSLPDEVVSLPTGFLQAGAAGVIGTLWAVNDASTMLLMVHFYHRWLVQGETPAAALQQAQMWLRDTTNREKLAFFRHAASEVSPTPLPEHLAESVEWYIMTQDPDELAYAHPYYWAPFSLSGV